MKHLIFSGAEIFHRDRAKQHLIPLKLRKKYIKEVVNVSFGSSFQRTWSSSRFKVAISRSEVRFVNTSLVTEQNLGGSFIFQWSFHWLKSWATVAFLFLLLEKRLGKMTWSGASHSQLSLQKRVSWPFPVMCWILFQKADREWMTLIAPQIRMIFDWFLAWESFTFLW